MFIKKYILNLLFLIGFSPLLSGQCNLLRNIPIIDYDTTVISMVVDGLTNDTLGQNGQGLCAVGIDFRHEFIGDITMELVSPDGRIITLAGPAVPVSGNTSFTRWNVTYVPCTQLPSPDPGFSDVWDNLQPWGLFGNYTGQYYPTQGCLEDFDGGPVNGIWSLRIIDVSQFGSGRIQGIRLFFCDESGVDCAECRLDPGGLSGPSVEQCRSSSGLTLSDVQESFPLYPKDTSVYHYRWAIFNDTSLVEVVPQDTLLHLSVGTFKICNFQYAKIEMDILPDLPATLNIKTVNEYFQDSLICAKMGDSCIQVTIFPSTDTIFADTSFCENGTLIFYGDTISLAGVYTYNVSGAFCDTVVVVTVIQRDFDVRIVSETDTFTCNTPLIQLTGLVNGNVIPGAMYSWTTIDGEIVSDTSSDSIFINRPGWYFLELAEGGCVDFDSVLIYKNDEYPDVEILESDTLNCRTDTITLSVVSSIPYDTVIWTSSLPFIQENDQVKVFEPGMYTAEVVTPAGCRVVALAHIQRIDTISAYSVQFDSITCSNDTATAFVIHESAGSYSFQWTGVLPEYENASTARFIAGGMKTLIITDNLSGCTADYTFEITDSRVFASGAVLVDTITCSVDMVEANLSLDIDVAGYHWQGPGLSVTDSVAIIRIPGEYTVEVVTLEGCRTLIPFRVEADTSRAELILRADSLSCSVDSVVIILESDGTLSSFTWFDRNGSFFSSAREPFVYIPGTYTVEALNEAGCLSFGSVDVGKSSDLPDVSFTVDFLRCDNDSVQIIPDITDGLMFTWEFPDLSRRVSLSPFVTKAGTYVVTITDVFNPECIIYDEIQVGDSRVYPMIDIDHGQLTCFVDSALVDITVSPETTLYFVTGTAFYVENTSSFFVKMPGLYEVVATTESGCETRDTFTIFVNDIHPVIQINPFEPITCLNPNSRVLFESNIDGTDFEVYKEGDLLSTGISASITTPGQYLVIGISPNLCRDTLLFTMEADTLKPDLFISPVDTITCLRPEISLQASSTFSDVSISWPGFQQNPLTVSSGGIYTARAVNNLNGCFTEQTVNVPELKVFAGYQITSTKIDCRNQEVEIRFSPESDFENIRWSTGNPVIIPDGTFFYRTSVPGWYYFDVISSEKCVSRDSVFVAQDYDPPVITQVRATEIDCTLPFSVLEVEISSAVDSVVWLTPGGFRLSGNSVQSDQPGRHDIRIYGQNGCIKDTFVNVIENVKLPSYVVVTDSLTCGKGKGILAVITSDSIVSYNWTGPEQFSASAQQVLITLPGVYTVVVTNQNGCRDTTDVEVKGDYKMPEFTIQDTFLIPCDSSLVMVDVTAQDSLIAYYWSYEGVFLSADPVVNTNTAGNYSVRVTGRNGCISSKDFTLVQIWKPASFTVQSDTIRCNKPLVYLRADSPDPGAVFTWLTPGSQVLQGSTVETNEAGLFLLIMQDQNRCLDTAEVIVEADTMAFRTEIIQEGEIVCDQRDVVLSIADSLVSGRYQYRWFNTGGSILSDPESPEVAVRDPGMYRLVVFNRQNGCSGVSLKIVAEIASSFREIPIEVKQPPCEKFNFGSFGFGQLGGIPPYLIELNGVKYENVFDFHLLQPGDFMLKVTDSLGCTIDTIVSINTGTDPVLYVPVDTTLLLGDSLVINIDSAFWKSKGYTIQLFEKDELICDTSCQFPYITYPGNATVYTIRFTASEDVCSYEHTLVVYINENIFNSIPNVFSRNALLDQNRTFYIPESLGIEKIISMEIYDKWASPMFAIYNAQPGNPDQGWDGTVRGKNAETGVYVVICKLLLSNGRVVTYTGDVTILD